MLNFVPFKKIGLVPILHNYIAYTMWWVDFRRKLILNEDTPGVLECIHLYVKVPKTEDKILLVK
jgi:hypothetical protein